MAEAQARIRFPGQGLGGKGVPPEAASNQSRSRVTLCQASGSCELGLWLSIVGARELPSRLLVVPRPALPVCGLREGC